MDELYLPTSGSAHSGSNRGEVDAKWRDMFKRVRGETEGVVRAYQVALRVPL